MAALWLQESDELSAAQIMYPAMQCADIFFLGVRVCDVSIMCPRAMREITRVRSSCRRVLLFRAG